MCRGVHKNKVWKLETKQRRDKIPTVHCGAQVSKQEGWQGLEDFINNVHKVNHSHATASSLQTFSLWNMEHSSWLCAALWDHSFLLHSPSSHCSRASKQASDVPSRPQALGLPKALSSPLPLPIAPFGRTRSLADALSVLPLRTPQSPGCCHPGVLQLSCQEPQIP